MPSPLEGEIGPYFADDSAAGFNRSSILANIDGTSPQTGIPLTLKVYVYDTENNYAAVAGGTGGHLALQRIGRLFGRG